MQCSEWEKIKKLDSSKPKPAVQIAQHVLTKNVPHRPAGPRFSSGSLQRAPVPSSRPWPARRPSPWLSDPNPSPHISRTERQELSRGRGCEFAGANPSHFRDAQFTALDRLSPRDRVFPDSAVARNLDTEVLALELARRRRFDMSEQSKSADSGNVFPGREWHRESRFPSDLDLGYQGNKFFASDSQQPRDPDPLQQCGTRFAVSDRLSPRDASYTPSDLPPAHGVLYSVSDRTQSRNSTYASLTDNVRFRDSDQQSSHGSRFGGLDELSLQDSRLRGSDQVQIHEARFVERDLLDSRALRFTVSDPLQFNGFEDTVSRVPISRDERFSGSDFTPELSLSSYTNW